MSAVKKTSNGVMRLDFSSVLGFKTPKSPVTTYGLNRMDLYHRWHGTIMQVVWKYVAVFTAITLVFFIIFVCILLYSDHPDCDDDGVECRPNWLDEHMSALSHVEAKMTNLASIVLTFYLVQAYARYNDFYWNCRAIQGRINDVALIVGSNINWTEDPSPELEEWAATFERYLNLAHFLCHCKTSPVLKGAKLFAGPQDRHFNPAKQSALMNSSILGYGADHPLCTEEEYKSLKEAQDIGGPNGPVNAVIVWLCMMFDKGTNEENNFFRTNVNAPRLLSLSVNFQDNMEALRGSIAKLGFELQLPVPLAYAHLMQCFVDIVCLIHPFASVYDINTEIVKHVGYNEVEFWSSLPITLVETFVFVYFYQGMMQLAKIFTHPLGHIPNATDKKQLDQAEFFIEVRTIMSQVRAGTYMFFNAGRMAPLKLRPEHSAHPEAVAMNVEPAAPAEEPEEKEPEAPAQEEEKPAEVEAEPEAAAKEEAPAEAAEEPKPEPTPAPSASVEEEEEEEEAKPSSPTKSDDGAGGVTKLSTGGSVRDWDPSDHH